MFTPPITTNAHASAANVPKGETPNRRQRDLSQWVGALTVGPLLAATLSVALPPQVHVLPQAGGYSTATHNITGQTSRISDGMTTLMKPVQGQKG